MTDTETGSPAQGRWSIAEIPFESIETERVAGDTGLFYLLTAASFVEITSDLYTRSLIDYFHDDPEVARWLEGAWQHEELQHGRVLRTYVRHVWPAFDWERAYGGFHAEYSRLCVVEQLAPSPALEMVARCLVETGTATLYTALQRLSPEPVLRQIIGNIRNDEVRHYKHFYRYFLRYRDRERPGRYAVLRTLRARVAEIEHEDAYYAFKHVFLACHPGEAFREDVYREFRRHIYALGAPQYPYEMAVKMFLKPLGLRPALQRLAVPLLSAGIRRVARRHAGRASPMKGGGGGLDACSRAP